MRFEAGTGNIADAVGLGAALEYVERLGIENIHRYEHDLLAYATRALVQVPGLRLIGTAADKASVLSFVLDGYEPTQIGEALSDEGIAVRAGTTAPSRSSGASARRRPYGRRSASTTRPTRSITWRASSTAWPRHRAHGHGPDESRIGTADRLPDAVWEIARPPPGPAWPRTGRRRTPATPRPRRAGRAGSGARGMP